MVIIGNSFFKKKCRPDFNPGGDKINYHELKTGLFV